MPEAPDKRHIAASFSKAAASYDSVADLQRQVGTTLLQRLPPQFKPQHWLDVGSGTGYFSRVLAQHFPESSGTALDLAEGVVRHAYPQGGARYFVCGDAEHLPLATCRYDLLFSSLALQWCTDFSQVLAEAQRVLRPGGLLVFSSLCTQTLHELRSSWQQVDGFVHVNRFRPLSDYQHYCAQSSLELLELNTEIRTLHYGDLRAITHELKALGAHNVNPGRPDGLMGRARLRALMTAYEGFRQPQGLPVSLEVLYGVLRAH